MALIFTAKPIVRAEDMKKHPLYFLAGTMINVTYSVMIGLILKAILISI
jgi:tetrahydromethanopterin S-methyltransferase subunit B